MVKMPLKRRFAGASPIISKVRDCYTVLQNVTELGTGQEQCLCCEFLNSLLSTLSMQRTNAYQRIPPSYYGKSNPSSSAIERAVCPRAVVITGTERTARIGRGQARARRTTDAELGRVRVAEKTITGVHLAQNGNSTRSKESTPSSNQLLK